MSQVRENVTWMELLKATLFVGKEVANVTNNAVKDAAQKTLVSVHNRVNNVKTPNTNTLLSSASKVLGIK